ncbi:hypothetical protein [Erythrobacter rubeus]|uniref:Uncharacterized protein n=1 Tax=Erythrobacter rubeus TaxID=2760803 RepID=A0ABR8KV82_9SPHN|nr:hypothetical protein [Erythrobacter rubeus]MBD2842041.1 hypothetical protein [Erythrobacter rubeus]
MTRRLLAFLALISGLAALSVPAAASYASQPVPCDSSVSAASEDVLTGERAQTKQGPGKTLSDAKGSRIERRTPRPRSLRMPVLMGIERAYE